MSDLTFMPPASHSYSAFIPEHIVTTGCGSAATSLESAGTSASGGIGQVVVPEK